MTSLSLLWRAYFKPRTWERGGNIYRLLGVPQIKEFYFAGRYFNALVGKIRGRKYRPFNGPTWLQQWLVLTFIAEIGHVLIGLFMVWYGVSYLAHGRVMLGLATLGVNIIVNVYPVMVQRYNRARLVRVLWPDIDSFAAATDKSRGARRAA